MYGCVEDVCGRGCVGEECVRVRECVWESEGMCVCMGDVCGQCGGMCVWGAMCM